MYCFWCLIEKCIVFEDQLQNVFDALLKKVSSLRLCWKMYCLWGPIKNVLFLRPWWKGIVFDTLLNMHCVWGPVKNILFLRTSCKMYCLWGFTEKCLVFEILLKNSLSLRSRWKIYEETVIFIYGLASDRVEEGLYLRENMC